MPILIVPLCVGKFVLKQKYVLVSRVDCMGIYVFKAYNAVPKYVCVEMSPNLCSAAKLEADVNGGTRCPNCRFWGVWRELVLPVSSNALDQSDCSILAITSPY